jgi:capsular polysaccharide biosynthesis protein
MFDILPRFGILQSCGLVPDYYLINTETRFQKESLKALGIPTERILSSTAKTHIEADKLIIPSLLGPVFGLSPQRQACEYLRNAFLPKDTMRKPDRAIYITRGDANTRRVINEAEIREEVLEHGFEIVSLTGLPFLEQVKLFAEARIVVGPHGAGFTNAVFCQSGSALIEFMPKGWRINCFERLARLVGIRYHSIIGAELGADVSNDDHTVDREELRKLIRQTLS